MHVSKPIMMLYDLGNFKDLQMSYQKRYKTQK